MMWDYVVSFMGEVTPFDTTIKEDDRVTLHHASEDTEVDEIFLPLLQSLFKAMQELLERMLEGHLSKDSFGIQPRS